MSLPASHRFARTLRHTVLGLSLFTLSTPAWAYLDPSTGSMILSAVVGLFATIGLAVKTYWYRLKNLVRGRGRTGGDGRPPDGRPDDSGTARTRAD